MLKIFLIVLFTFYVSVGICTMLSFIVGLKAENTKITFWPRVGLVLFWPMVITFIVSHIKQVTKESYSEQDTD